MPDPHRTTQQPPNRGFTLVELLVVVAIIGVLVALVLTGLGRALGSSRAVVCQSNLRQIQLAWMMYMDEGGGRIPYTRKSYLDPSWVDALDMIVMANEHLLDNEFQAFTACPEIESDYQVSYVTGRWGYAVNTWWDNIEKTHNDAQLWTSIERPSSYPCFTDPDVIKRDFGYRAAGRVPRTAPSGFGEPNWGVGPVHGKGEQANVAYADGSARPVDIDEVHAGTVTDDDWPWFANIR